MAYNEEDFLLISGIQHFSFCRRQWALIHVENEWADNYHTVSGELMHERAHDPFFTEKRGDLIITRDMPVFSREMGVTGHCDIVEFKRDDAGIPLPGREGRWQPCPVEYKRGHSKTGDSDRLQLCAQVACLEEMLCCPPIETAFLFYGETKKREAVPLDGALRKQMRNAFEEMRGYYDRGYTPRVKPGRACLSCSLNDICLPKLPASATGVRKYIERTLKEDLS